MTMSRVIIGLQQFNLDVGRRTVYVLLHNLRVHVHCIVRRITEKDLMAHPEIGHISSGHLHVEHIPCYSRACIGSCENRVGIDPCNRSPLGRQTLSPPVELRIIHSFTLQLTQNSCKRSSAIRVEEKNSFPPTLRPLIRCPASSSSHSQESTHLVTSFILPKLVRNLNFIVVNYQDFLRAVHSSSGNVEAIRLRERASIISSIEGRLHQLLIDRARISRETKRSSST